MDADSIFKEAENKLNQLRADKFKAYHKACMILVGLKMLECKDEKYKFTEKGLFCGHQMLLQAHVKLTLGDVDNLSIKQYQMILDSMEILGLITQTTSQFTSTEKGQGAMLKIFFGMSLEELCNLDNVFGIIDGIKGAIRE